ncbi:MAG: SurA N-terminal domain-containing protein [Thermodesulfobacteriota bacterium]
MNVILIKTGIRRAIIFLLLLFTAAVSTGAPGTAAAEVVDRIVAYVNEEIILLSELEKSLNLYEEALRARNLPQDAEKELRYRAREDMIQHLVDKRLTRQEAGRLGVTVDEREVDEALNQMKRSMLYTDEDLRQSLAEKGYTLDEYKNELRDQILRQRILTLEVKSKVVVTPADIQAYYDAHPEKYGAGKQYHLRNIIMRVDKTMPEEAKATVFAIMQELHGRLSAGASFADLASRYSQSSFAEKGGDLGLFSLDDLSPQLREAVEPLQTGQFTQVIDTPQGYQILYLEEAIDQPAVTLEKASEEIREQLYTDMLEAQFEKWVTQLREKSHIKIVL